MIRKPRDRNVTFERSLELAERAHAVIPGGCHTYAKGDDQYPILAPGFIARGQGCHVWDADGNQYIEYGMGLRAVTLGHGYPPVVAAAYQAMQDGTNFTRPAPIEVECAERLLELIVRADMVKFAKNGSDATTGAVKLARAFTGRDLVAVCRDQPFLSVDDWYLAITPMAAGIPSAIRETTRSFRFNDLDDARALFAAHPGKIACVILEAATAAEEPQAGYLQSLRQLCTAEGALLILDEMITGFRWDLGGAQNCFDVTPDLSTFGKGMANGFAVAALAGKREIMERGGLRHDRERVFLLSTTHGAETHALAAAAATMLVYQREGVVEALYRIGERLRGGIDELLRERGLSEYFAVLGRPCNMVYATRDRDRRPSQAFRALFLQELIRHGILAPSFVVSFSHSNEDIDRTIDAVAAALTVYARALDDGPERHLVGRPVQPVMRPYN